MYLNIYLVTIVSNTGDSVLLEYPNTERRLGIHVHVQTSQW